MSAHKGTNHRRQISRLLDELNGQQVRVLIGEEVQEGRLLKEESVRQSLGIPKQGWYVESEGRKILIPMRAVEKPGVDLGRGYIEVDPDHYNQVQAEIARRAA